MKQFVAAFGEFSLQEYDLILSIYEDPCGVTANTNLVKKVERVSEFLHLFFGDAFGISC